MAYVTLHGTSDRLRVRMSDVTVAGRYADRTAYKNWVCGFANASDPWMLEVRQAEREVCRRLRDWATMHGLPLWKDCHCVRHTVRHGLRFLVVLNNPDEEGEREKYGVGCRCDMLMELLEVHRPAKASSYTLLWRLVSGDVTRAAPSDLKRQAPA
jgi:hypothetical protein